MSKNIPLSTAADRDVVLMTSFQEGDESAFTALFSKYEKVVVNFAYRFLGRREEAEDIAQEVFVRLYRRKDRYDSRRPFRPWLFAIAARLASNLHRDHRRHRWLSLDQKPTEDLPGFEPPDPSPLPLERVEKEQLAQAIRKALSRLPETQRTSVLLTRFEDMSYEEIGQAMNTSVTAVKSLLFRARQTLKKELAAYVTFKEPLEKKAPF